MRNLVEKILFRVRWLGMSERSKYAVLWARTRESMEDEYFARYQWEQKSVILE